MAKKTETKWIGGWSEDAARIGVLVSNLKGCGIKARSAHSPYAGHLELQVADRDLEKAQKVMKAWGLEFEADSLGEKTKLLLQKWISSGAHVCPFCGDDNAHLQSVDVQEPLPQGEGIAQLAQGKEHKAP